MTQYYIGCKQIEAWESPKDGVPGYTVKYPDGYLSWSPKDTFESAYFPMGEGECETKINPGMVDDMIVNIETKKHGQKTTAVCATLANGFEIIESSSCVDPENYNEDLGREICIDRIRNKVWELLGFTLQWSRGGLKRDDT